MTENKEVEQSKTESPAELVLHENNDSYGLPGLPDFQYYAKAKDCFKDTEKTIPVFIAGFVYKYDCEKYIHDINFNNGFKVKEI